MSTLDASTKVCNECGLCKPLTSEHFHRNRTRHDGFADICRECRSTLRHNGRRERRRRAERASIFRIALLFAHGKARLSRENADRLTNGLLQYFGGPDGLARHYWTEYEAAGANRRAKLILGIFGLLRFYAPTESEPSDGLGQVTDEELDRAIAKLAREQT